MSSNTPTGPTYGVFISQVHRFFRANNTMDGFYVDVNSLVHKLEKQGFVINKLRYHLAKFLLKNFIKVTFKY